MAVMSADWAAPQALTDWFDSLEPARLADIAPDPARAAVFCADMIAGFCDEGALASARVGALVAPVTSLFRRARDYGIRDFVLLEDAHDPRSPEFESFPPHCVGGTAEALTVAHLSALPFSESFVRFPKNSLSPAIGTGFDEWLANHREIQTGIVVGNCTDLCVYQLGMHLRLRANALGAQPFQVVLVANAVDTYDAGGAFTHPGDFFHRVFLYHLALNGVRVVREIA